MLCDFIDEETKTQRVYMTSQGQRANEWWR